MAGRQTNVKRKAAELRRGLGSDLALIRRDAGIPMVRLAAATGISRAHLWDIEAGRAEASTEVLVRLADALGANLSLRAYPGTGPRIRDHVQGAIEDAFLRILAPRWRRFVEVPVYRPARGVIDLVLHDGEAGDLVAAEVQSELRRMEQVLRWSNQKRDSLPSADLWQFAAARREPRLSSLLVLRSTVQTRAVVAAHEAVFQAAFPARTSDVLAALMADAPWPGSAMLWAIVEKGRARIMDRPPRGLIVGR